MITNHVPNTWRDLQSEVARILGECGFSVEIEKPVETARGKVVIDVYAEETVKGRKYVILCECKHWKRRVPKSVIHSFRTVISDIGANAGYIVSLAGFQSGAHEATAHTNLELVTWEQLQSSFEETWFDTYFSPSIAEELDALLTYTEPILPRWFSDLPEEEKNQFIELKKKHDPFGWMIMMCTPYLRMVNKEARVALPIINRVQSQKEIMESVPVAILQASGYREFCELAIQHGRVIIEKFRAFRPHNSS